MEITCIQMAVAFGDPKTNFKNVATKIKTAAQTGADVIILPEMWNTGYALTELATIADEEGKETQYLLSKLADQLKVNIIGGSVAVKEEGEFYNRTYVYDRTGKLLSQYDKVHLFGLMAEDKYLTAGRMEHLFELDGIKQSSAICYDLRFSEWQRHHALKGAHVLYVPAQWPEPRLHHWRTLLQARAIENQCFVVGINVCGNNPENIFAGHSLIVNPWGEIIAEADAEERFLSANLDLEQVAEARGRIPVFADRRPELYQLDK